MFGKCKGMVICNFSHPTTTTIIIKRYIQINTENNSLKYFTHLQLGLSLLIPINIVVNQNHLTALKKQMYKAGYKEKFQ